MSHLPHNAQGTSINKVLQPEITGSLSFTKDGLHFEIVSFEGIARFRIFDPFVYQAFIGRGGKGYFVIYRPILLIIFT